MVLRHECIPLEASADWKEALQGIKHAFAHTWENCYAMQLTTGLKTYLYHLEAGSTRVVCPISERVFEEHCDIVTPYGFSGFVGDGDFPGFPHHWEAFAKDKNYVCGYIGLNPILENDSYLDPGETHHYNSIHVIDLTLSIEEIFANLSTNRKRQLKCWEGSLPNVVLEKSILIDFFFNHYYDFIRRVNAAPVYRFSGETLSFLFSLDNVFIVGAGGSKKIEAVSAFAYTQHVADFLFNVSLPEGKHYSVVLLWYAINYLKSLQIPFLNLGGGIRENDGVAQFKQRFGGRRLALKCLKQVYRPAVYEDLCRRVNADPNDLHSYFPPYRKSAVQGMPGPADSFA